ncbi:MAG: hypothetical protein ABIR48_01305 [Gammaproteobacteria bacterium]
MRKQRYGFSRGMVTVLVALWLALAFQPCVMAGVQALEPTSCDGCPDDSSLAQQGMTQTDCHDTVACASMKDDQEMQVAGFARSLVLTDQPLLIAWVTDYPSVSVPCGNLLPIVNNTPNDPPRLLRFCILQI